MTEAGDAVCALYSRRGCTLCEEAIAELEAGVPALDFAVRDVDANADWRARHAHCLPVLAAPDGQVIFAEQCDLVAARRWLAARP